jgi:pimeloyl-ACP methyl ester carboxylesterase
MPKLSENNPNYFLTSDKIKIFYNTNFKDLSSFSNKPVLLFNYGLVCNNAHWKHQVEYFDSQNYPIIIHNYRDHYNSGPSSSIEECTISNIVNDITELLNHLNVKRCVSLGHSMGVNITLELASKFELEKMVLISGTVIPPHEVMFDSNIIELISPYWEMFAHKFPNIYENIWKTSYLNPIIEKIIHTGGFNTSQVSTEFIQIYLKRMGQLPPPLFLHLMEEMRKHTIIGKLDQIKTKTLIIGGDKDSIIPNYLQKSLHKFLKNSELYIVKDGCHVPQIDFPNRVNERIELFLNQS